MFLFWVNFCTMATKTFGKFLFSGNSKNLLKFWKHSQDFGNQKIGDFFFKTLYTMLEILGYNQCFFFFLGKFSQGETKTFGIFLCKFLKTWGNNWIFLPILQNQKIGGKNILKRGYNKQNKLVIKYCTKNLTPYKYHSCKWYQIELWSVE